MNNDVFLEIGATPEPFFQNLREYLSNNIDGELCRAVANLLSLDYVIRLKFSPEINQHIDNCIRRIQDYLGSRVILESGMSETMELFIVAITEDSDQNKEILPQEQLIDAAIESTIAQSFSELSAQEKTVIRMILKEIVKNKNSQKLLSMINSDPELLKKLVIQGLKSKATEKEIAQNITERLRLLVVQAQNIERQKINLKNIYGKLSLATGLLITGSLGVVFSGLVLPAIIIPSAIAAIKTAPTIGEKIANNAIQKNENIHYATQILKRNKIETLEKAERENATQKGITKEIHREEKKHIPVSASLKKEGHDIASSVASNLRSPQKAENSFEKKAKQQKPEQSKGLFRAK